MCCKPASPKTAENNNDKFAFMIKTEEHTVLENCHNKKAPAMPHTEQLKFLSQTAIKR